MVSCLNIWVCGSMLKYVSLWFHAFCVHIKNEEISWYNTNLVILQGVITLQSRSYVERMGVCYACFTVAYYFSVQFPFSYFLMSAVSGLATLVVSGMVVHSSTSLCFLKLPFCSSVPQLGTVDNVCQSVVTSAAAPEESYIIGTNWWLPPNGSGKHLSKHFLFAS